MDHTELKSFAARELCVVDGGENYNFIFSSFARALEAVKILSEVSVRRDTKDEQVFFGALKLHVGDGHRNARDTFADSKHVGINLYGLCIRWLTRSDRICQTH